MKIQYRNKKLSIICTNYDKAKRKYNDIVAKKIIKAINFIEGANNLIDIINYPPFHFHDLKGNLCGLYSIDLGRKIGFRLIIKPLDSMGNTYSKEQVFSPIAIEIVNISVEEVSNHYE